MALLSAVFVIGPSGAGKSQISEWIVADLRYLLIDIDGRNVFGTNQLRKEWDQYYRQLDAGPLVSALHNRITAANCPGVVLSFPSTTILTREQIDCARSVNINTVLLWGTKENCMKAALERPIAPVSSEEQYAASNWSGKCQRF